MPEAEAVRSMFGGIAKRYDLANHMLSGGMDYWWRRVLVKKVKDTAPSLVVDLATGSGDVAFALKKKLSSSSKVIRHKFSPKVLFAEQPNMAGQEDR